VTRHTAALTSALLRAAERTDTSTDAGRAVAAWLRALARGEGVAGGERPAKPTIREVTTR
jgi:hypothetical protein